jgi:hypothetical protein
MAIKRDDVIRKKSERKNLNFEEAFKRGHESIPKTMSTNRYQIFLGGVIRDYKNGEDDYFIDSQIRDLAEIIIEGVFNEVLYYCKDCPELDEFISGKEMFINNQVEVLRKFVKRFVENN